MESTELFRNAQSVDLDVDLALVPATLRSLCLEDPTPQQLSLLPRLPGLAHLRLLRLGGSAAALAPLRGLASLERLDLTLDAPPEEELLALLRSLPSLRALRVELPAPEERSALARVASLPALHTLRLSANKGARELGLEALAAARGLRVLSLQAPPAVLASDALALAALPSLEALQLEGASHLGADAVASLARLGGLRELALEDVKNLPDQGYAPLAELSSLESLSLRGSGASGKVMAYVSQLLGLRSLNLGWCNIEGRSLEGLAKLTRLERLRLHNARVSGAVLSKALAELPLREVGAYGLRQLPWIDALARTGTLETLDVTSSGLTDAKLAVLARAPRLRELTIDQCKAVSARGLRALARAPALLELGLSQCERVDGEALESLRGSTLEALNVSFLELGARGLAALGALPRLRSLSLAYARGVDDEGLRALGGLRSLRELNVQGQRELAPEVLLALCEAVPLERLTVWGCPRVVGATVRALVARRPTLAVHSEDWQRGQETVLPAASLEGCLGNTLLSPDLRRALSHDFKSSAVLERAQGSAAPGPPVSLVHADVFRACGTLLATGRERLLLHALPEGQLLAELGPERFAKGASIVHATATAEGSHVAVLAGAELLVFALPRAEERWRAAVSYYVWGAQFSADGALLAAYGHDGVRLYRAASGELLWHQARGASYARPLGDALAVHTLDGALEQWSLSEGAVLSSWRSPPRGAYRRLSAGPGFVCRRREPVGEYELGERAVRVVRGRDGELRALLDRNGFCAELWARGEVLHVSTGTNEGRAQLSDDGALVLVPSARGALRNDLYEVDALFDFARSASR